MPRTHFSKPKALRVKSYEKPTHCKFSWRKVPQSHAVRTQVGEKQNKTKQPKKSYMQSKRWKVKVPGLQLLREVASLLWQSTESFNNRQRAHDGSGPMGFKRINIQVNSKQRCIMGTALHLWIGEKEKNILNAIYNIQNTRHAQQQKCLLKKWILQFELVPKQKCIYYTLVKSI